MTDESKEIIERKLKELKERAKNPYDDIMNHFRRHIEEANPGSSVISNTHTGTITVDISDTIYRVPVHLYDED